MTKDERIKRIEIAARLEEIQSELEAAELIITAQKLAVNQIIGEILKDGAGA